LLLDKLLNTAAEIEHHCWEQGYAECCDYIDPARKPWTPYRPPTSTDSILTETVEDTLTIISSKEADENTLGSPTRVEKGKKPLLFRQDCVVGQGSTDSEESTQDRDEKPKMVLKWQIRGIQPKKGGGRKLKKAEMKKQRRVSHTSTKPLATDRSGVATTQGILSTPGEGKASEPYIATIESIPKVVENKPTLMAAKNRFLRGKRGSVVEELNKAEVVNSSKEDFRSNIIRNSLKF